MSITLSATQQADPNALLVGESTLPRTAGATGALSTSGTLRLTYFTSKGLTTTQVRVVTGATAAAATPTLCRMGIYSVASDGSLTLVASTANDTTLFAAVLTSYTRAFTVPVALAAGQRYAFGILVVSAAALPNFGGATLQFDAGVAPRLTAAVASQADLPATVAVGSLASSSAAIYGALLP